MKGRWRKFDTTMPQLHKLMTDNKSKFDAVFISTKNNHERVQGLLEELQVLNNFKRIFILPTNLSDVPKIDIDVISLLSEYLEFSQLYFREFNPKNWDLSYKRNFSIWYSKINSYSKILLLDDDIRFKGNEASIHHLISELENNWVSGAYSIGEFDTSIIGEIATRYGISRPAFLSGNCLGINIEKFTPFFPDIYNEDWLSVLPAVITNSASVVGPVIQLARQCSWPCENAKFQEFGEIIADELYSHLENPNTPKNITELVSTINEVSHWEKVISDRVIWLKQMEEHILENDFKKSDVKIVKASLTRTSSITAQECLHFIRKWMKDTQDWGEYLNNKQVLTVGECI